MKPLDVRFPDSVNNQLNALTEVLCESKSSLAREAMEIGLSALDERVWGEPDYSHMTGDAKDQLDLLKEVK